MVTGRHITQGCERKKQVDNRKCEHEGCSKVASFNVIGDKRRRFCKQHSEPGMQVQTTVVVCVIIHEHMYVYLCGVSNPALLYVYVLI